MRSLLLVIPFGLVIAGVYAPAKLNNSKPTMEREHIGLKFEGGSQSDSCIICHDGQSLMLRSESNELCYPCHNSVREKSAKTHTHPEVVSERYPGFDCEGCHRIHRADGDHFLKDDELVLCQGCHEETRQYKSHPVVTYTDSYGRQTAVLGPDGTVVTCASHCHDVHGTDFEFLCRLEPGRELCIACHTELE